MEKRPVMLCIMDGFGLDKPSDFNAVSRAKKPNLDALFKKYPNNTLEASGEAVGLPDGQMGNSEVGHLNIGAGRVVYQSFTRINMAIRDGSFFENKAYLEAINYVKNNNSKLHIFGLCSDGGVHSHTSHIKALIKMAYENGLNNVYYHAFLDGRDTPTTSGAGYLKSIIDETNVKVGVVSGRYYAMDRDKNWDRIQLAYDALTLGNCEQFSDPIKGIEASYEKGVTDEFLIPFISDKNGLIESDDAIIFANFRPDRAIQIGTAFSNQASSGVDYSKGPKDVLFVSTMTYADSVKGPIAFGLQSLNNLFGDVISSNNMKQLRIAETEKYAHVTFFFDGGADKEIEGSDRILVHSPKVATYDLKPEMSAYEVCDKVVEAIHSKKYDTIILNFANCDMVGHTGVIDAAIKAVEAVDTCVGRVEEAISQEGGVLIITADHGNAEKLQDELGRPFTAHTTNLVPVIITDNNIQIRDGGKLCDIAPTMLEYLGIKQPQEMTGKSLLLKK